MAGNSPEEIKKVKRAFLAVGLILMICTALTVAVAVYPPFDIGIHGFSMADAILGLGIATFKASCVALIFMHLRFGKWEKPTILWTFFGSIFFAGTMIGLLLLADFNPITFKGVVPYGSDMPATQAPQAYDLDKFAEESE